jgi:hypothetical protein
VIVVADDIAPDSPGISPHISPGISAGERSTRAGLWESGADERERLADERERLADEREALADERQRVADRQESAQAQREAGRIAADEDDGAAEVLRAEAAVRRAEAELERTRQAAARAQARAVLRIARTERAAAALLGDEAGNADDAAWLADRRDFVAVERDSLADERDRIADKREKTAGLRERRADDREHELLDRERLFDQKRPAVDASARADDERRRERATADRHAAAHDRARAAEAWRPQTYGPMLLAAFAPLARQLFGNDNLRDALAEVLKFTVGAVAGCDSAGITLYQHGRVADAMTTDAVAAELDDLQFATGIGPALEAMQGEQPVYAADLAAAPRWPVFSATASQLGMSSAVCYGLYVHRPSQWSALGTFDLYGATPDGFSEDDREFGSILAAYLGLAVASAQRHDEVDRREAALHRGLGTRDIIGQAKGILMERQRLSAGDAFDLLRRVSQRLNRKLSDVAQELAETGELPG